MVVKFTQREWDRIVGIGKVPKELEYTLEKKMPFIVHCAACDETHRVSDVEFQNVEEDWQGEDVMFFRCRESNTNQQSKVYGCPDGSE